MNALVLNDKVLLMLLAVAVIVLLVFIRQGWRHGQSPVPAASEPQEQWFILLLQVRQTYRGKLPVERVLLRKAASAAEAEKKAGSIYWEYRILSTKPLTTLDISAHADMTLCYK